MTVIYFTTEVGSVITIIALVTNPTTGGATLQLSDPDNTATADV